MTGVRTNLCTNPSFENNTTDWNVYAGHATIAQSTSHPSVGTKSGLITWEASTSAYNQVYLPFAAVVGQLYTISVDVYVPSGSAPVNLNYRSGSATSTVFDAKQRLSVTAAASSSTENLVMTATTSLGGTCFIDAVLIEKAPLAGAYFDGNSSGGAWSGTAGNSTSTLAGAPAITVVGDPNNVPPRQIIFVTGSSGVTIAINRTDPDGVMRPVRTAEAAPLGGGQWAGYDYESPFSPTGPGIITYTVTPSDGSTPFSTTVGQLNIAQAWLIHPGVPSLSQKIRRVTLSGTSAPSGATAHNVLGRPNPVMVTDGVRKGKTFTLTIRTPDSLVSGGAPLYPGPGTFGGPGVFSGLGGVDSSAPVEAAFDALFADTAPLLLQLVYPFTAAHLYLWISIGQVDVARVSMQFGEATRIITLPCTVVDRPAGGIAAQRTWADLMAECATWADVLAKYATWQGAFVGTPGT